MLRESDAALSPVHQTLPGLGFASASLRPVSPVEHCKYSLYPEKSQSDKVVRH